ncbi:MAG: DUF5930 domain-containing protein [Pikeienuella sp.]
MRILRVISDQINARLERLAPERRLFVRSEHATRYYRISPLAQIGAVAVLGIAITWSVFTSVYFAVSTITDSTSQNEIAELQTEYESRIAQFETDRFRIADQLSASTHRAETALERLSHQHVSLSNAVAAEQKLALDLQAKRVALDSLTGAHDATQRACTDIAARMTALEVELARLGAENTELLSSLAVATAAVEQVSGHRDTALSEFATLSAQMESLQEQIEERKARQSRVMSQIEDAARVSLSSMEQVFKKSGVKLEPILNAVRKEFSGQGGLYQPLSGDNDKDAALQHDNRMVELLSDLTRLNEMVIAADRMPFGRPVGAARLSSRYGKRKDPIKRTFAFHGGMDFAAKRGTPIRSTGEGLVVSSGWVKGYGKVVKIRHAFGYETVYAHLHRRRVKVGDQVEKGDLIGDMGSTGRSTGNHLHYEIRLYGKTVNPAKFIEAARHVL